MLYKNHTVILYSHHHFLPFAVPTLPVVVSRLNYSVVSDGDQVEAIYDQGQLSLRRLQQNPFYPIEDVTLEADYSGYRLTQPLKKTPPAAAVLSSTAIKFPIKVDNVGKNASPLLRLSPFSLAQSAKEIRNPFLRKMDTLFFFYRTRTNVENAI